MGEYSGFFDQTKPAERTAENGGYGSFFDRGDGQRLRSSLRGSTAFSPDRAAQDLRLAREVGVPVDAVRTDPAQVEQLNQFQNFDFERIETETPVLARHLSNPSTAAAVSDDIENLSYWERWLGDYNQAAEVGDLNPDISRIGTQMLFGQDLSASDQNLLARSRRREAIDFDLAPFEGAVGTGLGFVAGVPGAVREMAPQMINDLTFAGAAGVGGAAVGGGLALAAGQLGPQIALPEEVATVPLGAGAGFSLAFNTALTAKMGMTEAGHAMVEFSDMRDDAGEPLDPVAVRGAAVLVGIVNGALERVGFNAIAKQFPGADKILNGFTKEGVKTALRSGAARQLFSRLGAGMAQAAATEGVTEFLQESTNILFGEFARLASGAEGFEGDDFFEEALARASEAGIRGAQAGTGFGGGGAIVSTATDLTRARLAHRQEQSLLADGQAAAKESKTVQRDSVLFEEIVRDQLGPDASIYMDAEQAREFFQDDARLEAFAEQVPEFREQYEEALAVGGDVILPASRVMEMWGKSDAFDDAIELMRLTPDAITDETFQSEYLSRIIPEIEANEAASEGLIEGEQVERNISDQLMNAGRTPDAARKEATLWRAFHDTMASRGADRASLDRIFGGVTIEREGQAPLPRVTELDPVIEAARNAKPVSAKRDAPVLRVLREKGGVRTGSVLAGELQAMGITAQTQPGLFRKAGTLGDVDTIVGSEHDVFANELVDDNGYVDRQLVLDRIQQEFGVPAEAEVDTSAEGQLLEQLDELGIDIQTATNEEIKAALDGARTFEQAPAVGSDAFKEWFGDSKVVDENGEPLVVYHGTRSEFESFQSTEGRYFFGNHFGTVEAANDRLGALGNKRMEERNNITPPDQIIPVYLNIQNPMRMEDLISWSPENVVGMVESTLDEQDALGEDRIPTRRRAHGDFYLYEDIITFLQARGFDGVVYENVIEGEGDSYIAFDPTQIKSVHNRGAFDANDPRILFQDGEGPRASVQFSPQGETLITLMDGADMSSFLHESGHFFLEAFGELAATDEALTSDFDAVLKWLGVESADQIQNDQHEQFARGFEAWLMKGEAPSIELQSVFTRFRAWLTRIYREIKALNVTLTPEVESIFARMFATDEQIDAMEANPLFRPDPQVMEMLTKAERKDYIKRNERATSEAKEALFLKSLRQEERRNSKEYKAERATVREEVEARVNKSAVYQAVHFLQKGKFLDRETPADAQPLKLDRKAVAESFNKETIKFLPRGVTAVGGTNPEIVADMFGFSSADQMIRTMIGLPDRKAVVERQTDEEMVKRRGDLLTDGTIEREAQEAMMNTERAETIAYELRAVSRKAGVEFPSNKDFKAAAQKHLSSKLVDQAVKPTTYYYAEIKAARDAGKFLAQKDFARAAEAKRKQLLNHHLYREAREARVEVDKALKRFTKLNKAPAKGKLRIDPEYHERIWSLLDKYNLRPRLSDEKRERLSMQTLTDWQEARRLDENAPLVMPQEILDADNKTHYRDLTLEEFRGLRDLVLNLEHVGKTKNQIMVEGKKQELDEAANEAARIIRANVKPRKVVIAPSRVNNLKRIWIGIEALATKAETYVEQMDGFEKRGFIFRHVRASIRDGELARFRRLKVEGDKLAAIVSEHYGKRQIKLGGRMIDVSSEDLLSRKSAVFIQSLGESLTKEQRLAVALNWGNEDNRVKLMDGRGWTEPQVQEILDTLDERDWNFVQDTWDYINTFWTEVEALERRRSGFPPPKVEPDPVDTKFGTFRGGYYPLSYDPLLSHKSSTDDVNAEFQAMAVGRYGRAQTKHGHTEARVSGVQRPVQLTFDPLSQHINQVVTDLTMAEPIESAWKFLNHHAVSSAIEETLGVEAVNQLDMWIKDTAVGQIQATDGISKAFQGLRASVSVGAMGMKMSTTLIQLTGFTQTMVELGHKWSLVGMTQFLKNPAKSMRDVLEASPFMAERASTFHRDVFDTMNHLEGKPLQSAWTSAMFWPIAKMQMTVDIPTWLGAFQKAMAEGKTEEEAGKLADLMVETSQSSGFMSSLSAVERGSVSSSTRLAEFVKTWTSFYSYFNTKYNVAKRQTLKTDFSSPADIARLTSDYLMLFWVEALVGEFILGRMPDFDDEDDPALAAFLYGLGLGVSNAMATLPILRELAGSLRGFNASPGAARGVDAIARGARAIGHVAEAGLSEDVDLDFFKTAKALVAAGNVTSTLAFGVPIPASQINVAIDALERQNDGDDVGLENFIIYLPKD